MLKTRGMIFAQVSDIDNCSSLLSTVVKRSAALCADFLGEWFLYWALWGLDQVLWVQEYLAWEHFLEAITLMFETLRMAVLPVPFPRIVSDLRYP